MNEWDILEGPLSVRSISASCGRTHRRELVIIYLSLSKVAICLVVCTKEDVVVGIAPSLVKVKFYLCERIQLLTLYLIDGGVLIRQHLNPFIHIASRDVGNLVSVYVKYILTRQVGEDCSICNTGRVKRLCIAEQLLHIRVVILVAYRCVVAQ